MRNISILLAIIPVFFAFDLFSQKSVYYYQDTGFDTLTVFENKTFRSTGGFGLARAIEYSGDCKVSGDTLFLIHKGPTIINKLDTNYYLIGSQDTLIMIDDRTLVFTNHNNYGFYKLIEKYDNDILRERYSWKYSDQILKNVNIKGKFHESIRINNFPVQHGLEIHYDENGIIEKEYLWEDGKMIGE